MDAIYIGVDTGNRCIKTATQVMLSGIMHSVDPQSAVGGNDSIFFNGQYYSLIADRRPYDRDKTVDDDYFVLTLFAIVKELQARGINVIGSESVTSINLAVGLPPTHYNTLKNSFRAYFDRGTVSFLYGNKQCKIEIADVKVFVQGYSAICDQIREVSKFETAYVVDIGGYTTDIFELRNGVPNTKECYTVEAGMIHLYNTIQIAFDNRFGERLKENQIERMLKDKSFTFGIIGDHEFVENAAQSYVDETLKTLRERGANLRLCKGVFVGGGSVRLQEYIRRSPLVVDPIIVEDIRANAQGYELIAKHAIGRK